LEERTEMIWGIHFYLEGSSQIKGASFTLGYKCASKEKKESQPIKDWRKEEKKTI